MDYLIYLSTHVEVKSHITSRFILATTFHISPNHYESCPNLLYHHLCVLYFISGGGKNRMLKLQQRNRYVHLPLPSMWTCHRCLVATSEKQLQMTQLKKYKVIPCPKHQSKRGTYEQQFSSPTSIKSRSASLFHIYFNTMNEV